MNKVKQIVAEANFSNRAFPVGTEYASWETDEVIEGEFWRNMAISLLCVFLTTVILIQNIPACVMVLACVILTLVILSSQLETSIHAFYTFRLMLVALYLSGD